LLPEERFLVETYLDKRVKTVEAGTAGGRILFGMRSLGFSRLYGFDYVPGLIQAARDKDTVGSIGFDVQDAVSLTYDSASFRQIVYLQQILCTIENDESRLNAVREAYRILEPGGTALFSFLSFEARSKSVIYCPFLLYLRGLRKLSRSARRIQYLPWLRLGGTLNWGALLDRAPYVYWYRVEEIGKLLEASGFRILAAGSERQIQENSMCPSYETLQKQPIDGMIYFVCKK
jgi:SAM-dependent methyltransferase